jgi:hypothetical protein
LAYSWVHPQFGFFVQQEAMKAAAQAEANRQEAERNFNQQGSISFVYRDGVWELPDVGR